MDLRNDWSYFYYIIIFNLVSLFQLSDETTRILNEFILHLSRWKPHTEIVLVNSCRNEEISSYTKLVKSGLIALRIFSPECNDNSHRLSELYTVHGFQDSILAFSTDNREELLLFINSVNQVHNLTERKFSCSFFIFQSLSSVLTSFDGDNEFRLDMNFTKHVLNITTNFLVNSDAHFVIPSFGQTDVDLTFNIFEFYQLSPIKLVINPVFPGNLGMKGVTRMNFNGVQLKATAPKENMTQGEIVWGNDHLGNLILKSGFGTNILKSFQYSLNFEILVIPTDGWAKLLPNGSWIGMANEVLSGRADIGIAKTSILPYRAKELGYLIPIHTLIVTAFFRQPPISSVRNIFIYPFEKRLWIIVICTWILILSVCFAYGKLILQIKLSENDKILTEALGPWIITAISQHGFYITPNSMILRMVFIIGICYGVIIFVAYSATLVSIFTSKPIPINDFSELVRSGLTFVVDKDNSGANTVAIRQNDTVNVTYSPKASLLLDKVARGGSLRVDAKTGGGYVFKNDVAFLTFKDTFYTTVRNNDSQKSDQFLCNTVSSFTVTNIPFRSGLIVAKNSPYKEMFNNRLICLYTSGIMKLYVQHYEATYTPVCNPELENKETPSLENKDVFFAYILLCSGLTASGLVLMAELARSKLTI